jgi:nitrate/TMAO reductase-like tetraheme cytochrome c subunit
MKWLMERLRFRRWGKWILGGVVGMGLLGTISVEATSRSSFCNSCHIMEPYYTSWSHGAHKNVECVECHIEPGPTSFVHAKLNGLGQVVDDVLNRTSAKPSASVSQLSCLRSGCHTTETLEKRKINNGKFKFDHSKHFGQKHLGVEITCGTCHSHVKGDEHFEVNTSVCITCHLVGGATKVVGKADGRETGEIHFLARSNGGPHAVATPKVSNGDKVPPAACTGCHDAPEREIEFQGQKFLHSQFLSFGATCESCHQGVTATPPVIDDGRCLECHTFGIERSLESKEMHRVHTVGRHKIECSSCHGAVRHGPQVQTASLERFDCNRCHVDQHGAQRSMYFNAGTHAAPAAGGTDLVSPMFLAHVDCTGCHTKSRPVSVKPQSTARVMAAEPAACNQCHQPGFGERMIPLWQKQTRTMYDQVELELRTAESAGRDPALLGRVRAMLDLIRTDGSWGVHNPRYTQSILEQARALLAGKEGAG